MMSSSSRCASAMPPTTTRPSTTSAAMRRAVSVMAGRPRSRRGRRNQRAHRRARSPSRAGALEPLTTDAGALRRALPTSAACPPSEHRDPQHELTHDGRVPDALPVVHERDRAHGRVLPSVHPAEGTRVRERLPVARRGPPVVVRLREEHRAGRDGRVADGAGAARGRSARRSGAARPGRMGHPSSWTRGLVPRRGSRRRAGSARCAAA